MGAFVLIIVLIAGGDRAVAVSQHEYSSASTCQVAAKAAHDMDAAAKTACVPK